MYTRSSGNSANPCQVWAFVTEKHCNPSAVQRVGQNCCIGYGGVWKMKEGEKMRLSGFLGSAFS